VLRRAGKEEEGKSLEAAETAVCVLRDIVASDCIEDESKSHVAAALAAATLARVPRGASTLVARVAARLVESLLGRNRPFSLDGRSFSVPTVKIVRLGKA
jgi:hypothetical protein